MTTYGTTSILSCRYCIKFWNHPIVEFTCCCEVCVFTVLLSTAIHHFWILTVGFCACVSTQVFQIGFLKKQCKRFCNSFKFTIWSCRVAGIYSSCCSLWNDITSAGGCWFFGIKDGTNKFIFTCQRSFLKHEKGLIHLEQTQLRTVLYVRCMCRFLHRFYLVNFMVWV